MAASSPAVAPAWDAPVAQTATDQRLSRGIERWLPSAAGGALALLCAGIAIYRWRKRRKHQLAEARARASRRLIGWDGVRKPDLDMLQPALVSAARQSLPQLSVDIPSPSAEPPAWLRADVTVLHDTERAANQRDHAVHGEAESHLEWMLASSRLSSLTYRMKGLSAVPPAANETLERSASDASDATEVASSRLAQHFYTPGMHPADEAAHDLAMAAQTAFLDRPSVGEHRINSVAPAAEADTAIADSSGVHAETVPSAARVMREGDKVADAVAEAKRLLTFGRPQDAITALRPALSSPAASGEAWSVAGWCWWRVANDQSGRELEGAREAAEAFTQALKVEPGRVDLLSRMIGRCHVMCAQHQAGAARVQSLDRAIESLQRARAERSVDRAVELELAGALYERAVVSPHMDRAAWLDRVQNLLDGLPLREEMQSVWLQANTLWARADIVDARTAQTLHARAFALVDSHLPTLDSEQRDTWLTRLIDGERAHLQHLKGASRITRLQQIQPGLQARLREVRSISPLLSWIGVLGDWAANLHGAAAVAKLGEAEALFGRIQALAPEDSASLNFAHAYYLRLRSQRELSTSAQDAALCEAEHLLERVSDGGDLPLPLVQLESAEIHLARARLAEGLAADTHYAKAASLGAAAARAPENETRALACALTALIALQSRHLDASRTPPMLALAARLLSLAPSDPDALRLSAQVHLFAGEHDQASAFCDAAWNAGARRGDVLPIWQQADALWARQLGESDRDPHWKRLHQRMRMANSTT